MVPLVRPRLTANGFLLKGLSTFFHWMWMIKDVAKDLSWMINHDHDDHWMGKEDVGWKQEDVGASRCK